MNLDQYIASKNQIKLQKRMQSNQTSSQSAISFTQMIKNMQSVLQFLGQIKQAASSRKIDTRTVKFIGQNIQQNIDICKDTVDQLNKTDSKLKATYKKICQFHQNDKDLHKHIERLCEIMIYKFEECQKLQKEKHDLSVDLQVSQQQLQIKQKWLRRKQQWFKQRDEQYIKTIKEERSAQFQLSKRIKQLEKQLGAQSLKFQKMYKYKQIKKTQH